MTLMTEVYCQLPKAILARKDLTASAKLLYAYFVDRIGQNSHCWPGTRLIAIDVGMNRKTIQRAVARLESAGLLMVTQGHGGDTSSYRLHSLCGVEKGPGTKRDQGQKYPKGGDKSTPKLTHRTNPPTTVAHKTKSVTWDKGEQRFIVTPEQLARWTRDFPAVDVAAEVRKAGAWHAANGRWKSRYQAALTRWLNRAADSAASKTAVDSGDAYARAMQDNRGTQQ